MTFESGKYLTALKCMHLFFKCFRFSGALTLPVDESFRNPLTPETHALHVILPVVQFQWILRNVW